MPSRRTVHGILLVLLLISSGRLPASAQGHEPQPTAAGAQPGAPAHAAGTEEEHHDEGILPTVARLLNFAILAGVLIYFLGGPIGSYLAARSSQIRQDLVTAAETRRTAASRLEDIQRQLAALPAELDAMRTRGAEDIAAEERRIASTAQAERERLLEQTRREIDMQLRVARRDLTEHAAQLAVDVARARITRTVTREDQLRLLDRYAAQVGEPQ
ncbi:MAG TPA: ATP synthase F0 subunit B [Vicinamibacterales bacterium]|jgi:F-type H+-transporting ATPase subunit b|nr:ATP synthase F0 subunit B [Vicinamibacterales bacterium]